LEVWQAFPGLIFIIFVVAIIGSTWWSIMLTIGMLFAAGSSRVIRSAVLTIRWQPYMEAATVMGAAHTRIILRYLLPNIFSVIMVMASIQIGSVILLESSLAFLGLGIPEPYPSWGRMLQSAQRFMQSDPYLAWFPGAAIAVVVFSFNMLGDGLRDLLDPRLRQR
jgi:peptide/nickel transport system permease protein